MTLTDFLLARIAEDEARFHAHVRSEREEYGPDLSPEHVAELDRGIERVLRQVEAHRAIVEMLTPDGDPMGPGSVDGNDWFVLASLASIYADHPDYRDEWRP